MFCSPPCCPIMRIGPHFRSEIPDWWPSADQQFVPWADQVYWLTSNIALELIDGRLVALSGPSESVLDLPQHIGQRSVPNCDQLAPTWINRFCRAVLDIPVQVSVVGIKPLRIHAHPLAAEHIVDA